MLRLGRTLGSDEREGDSLLADDLFPVPKGRIEKSPATPRLSCCFSIVGHIDGHDRLAATTRRFALGLERIGPGTVRIENVERRPSHDLSRGVAAEHEVLTALAARKHSHDRLKVAIIQHWPIEVPTEDADLKLAWFPWGEGLVPLDTIRFLNENFQGLLVYTPRAEKALIDSGAYVPICVAGWPGDGDADGRLDAAVESAPTLRHPSKRAGPAGFPYVSAIVPRKGIDALRLAYAKAFHRPKAAMAVEDDTVWASRVRDFARDLLSRDPTGHHVAPSIAWVTSWNIPCGVATYSRYLLDHYADAGQDVTVLCDARTPQEGLISPGHPIARIAWRLPDRRQNAERIAAAIASVDPRAVVIQHHPALIGWRELRTLLCDRRLTGRAVILIMHSRASLRIAFDGLQHASRIVVHTMREARRLQAGGLVHNVTLLPHGSISPLADRPEVRDFPQSAAPVIGAYGFFRRHKGFDVLIRALAGIRREWPRATLRLVTAQSPDDASRSEIARCRALARALGLESAIAWHTDVLSDDASLAILASCDIVALPYRKTAEVASGAARVAMASRIPVLVTPVPIFHEMGDAVIRADGFTPASLAAAITTALRDRSLRSQTVDRAEHWLDVHDWTRTSERLRGMIRGLVRNGSTQARGASDLSVAKRRTWRITPLRATERNAGPRFSSQAIPEGIPPNIADQLGRRINRVVFVANNPDLPYLKDFLDTIGERDLIVQFNACIHLAHFAPTRCPKLFVFRAREDHGINFGYPPHVNAFSGIDPRVFSGEMSALFIDNIPAFDHAPDVLRRTVRDPRSFAHVETAGRLFRTYPRPSKFAFAGPSTGFVALRLFLEARRHLPLDAQCQLEIVLLGFEDTPRGFFWGGHNWKYERRFIETHKRALARSHHLAPTALTV